MINPEICKNCHCKTHHLQLYLLPGGFDVAGISHGGDMELPCEFKVKLKPNSPLRNVSVMRYFENFTVLEFMRNFAKDIVPEEFCPFYFEQQILNQTELK